MPFWSDVLRVGGAIVAPVLASTGVGLPLAIGIGAAAAAASNVGADAVDRAAENRANDERARQLAREARERIERDRVEAERIRVENERIAAAALEQSQLPERIMTACRSGDLTAVPSLLQRLTDAQFENLGLRPLGVCQNQEVRMRVRQYLDDESVRRFPQQTAHQSHRPR